MKMKYKNTPEAHFGKREYEENSYEPSLSYRLWEKDSETISNVSEAHR